jgi:hypothetical protein
MPITNIAFSLRIFMGDAAEPLSTVDLVGLVLVCIGFLTYSCFGFAANFLVAQVGYLSLWLHSSFSEFLVLVFIMLAASIASFFYINVPLF